MMAMTMTPALMSPVQMVMMMVGMAACTSTGAAPVTATRCGEYNVYSPHQASYLPHLMRRIRLLITANALFRVQSLKFEKIAAYPRSAATELPQLAPPSIGAGMFMPSKEKGA